MRDGALEQLFELVVYGFAAAGFYVVFKVCEKALVWRITKEMKASMNCLNALMMLCIGRKMMDATACWRHKPRMRLEINDCA